MPEVTQSTIPLAEFFEKRKTPSGQEYWVAVRPMTKEQARQAYPYRKPYSKYAESMFGGDTYCDDECLLLNRLAGRCRMCQAPTRRRFGVNGVCPDCDGRSELNGTNPHE